MKNAALHAELDAFAVLLASGPAGGPVCSALLRVWFEFAAIESAASGAQAPKLSEFLSKLGEGDLSGLPTVARELPDAMLANVIATAVGSAPAQANNDRALAAHYRALRSHPAVTGVDASVSARRVKRLRVMLIAIPVVSVVFVLLFFFSPKRPVWRATYFSTTGLTHPVATALKHDVGGVWGTAPAHVSQPLENFSDRWDTCLTVDSPIEVYFLLGSDDGGRLFVDDRLFLNDWSDHGYSERMGRAALAPGVHHIRAEHYDRSFNATLRVLWSESDDRESFKPITHSMLSLPTSGLSPCE